MTGSSSIRRLKDCPVESGPARALPSRSAGPWREKRPEAPLYASDAAVFTADHGEPLQRKGWAGAIPQEMLSRARGSAVDRPLLERHSKIAPDYLPVVAVAQPIENAAIDCVADSTHRSVGTRRVEAARMRRPKAGITRLHNLDLPQRSNPIRMTCPPSTTPPSGPESGAASPKSLLIREEAHHTAKAEAIAGGR